MEEWLTFIPKKSKSGIDRYPFRVFTGEQIRSIIERLVYVGIESDRIIKQLPKQFEVDMISNTMWTGQTTLTGEV